MKLQDLVDKYYEDGLTKELASARVCQDVILKAIAEGSLNRNVTMKGGIIMQNLTRNNRRATKDIDLDFIHYSLNDESIRAFVKKLDTISGLSISLEGKITELKHQDYHGKSITIKVSDEFGTTVKSKIDIGVHKHFEIEQEEYCFDICCDEERVSLLKNTTEQSFVEKLRSLLIFGPNSRRYKDIYDLSYLCEIADKDKVKEIISILIFRDEGLFENTMDEIIRRVSETFRNKQYIDRLSSSRQRWTDEDVKIITKNIINYLKNIK